MLGGVMDGATLNQMSLETPHCELLPGISDEITLNHITPKLSWRDLYNLSSISHGWCHAIRSRQVYNARVRLKSTEHLVLIDQVNEIPDQDVDDNDLSDEYEYVYKEVNVITLFSMKDRTFYQLPSLPLFDEGRGCVTLDGKVYVLLRKGHVYMMDLAGQRKWTQCASRGKHIKSEVKCGAVHGKIYVFHESPHDGPEVFDPAGNSWSVMKPPLIELCTVSPITTVGEELFLFFQNMFSTHLLQVYNPPKDEWREVHSPHPNNQISHPFSRQGKFHCFVYNDEMNGYDVKTFDVETNSWTDLCSLTFKVLEPCIETREVGMDTDWKAVVVVDDDELLVIVAWWDATDHWINNDLFRTTGFGSHHGEIMWQMVGTILPPSCPSGPYCVPPCSRGHSMSSIEL